MERNAIFVAATMVLALALATEAKADDPFTGTWRLDPSRTENSAPSQLTFRSITNGISLQTDRQMPFVAYYNGKDYPLGTGRTINALRLNDHTLVSTTKRNGKILSKATVTVSPDGKQTTTFTEGRAKEGTYKDISVRDRVGPAPSGDAFLGTWQEDLSQTQYEPSLTYQLRVTGAKLDLTTNRGEVIRAKLDGKDHRQDTSDTTVRLNRIDGHTIEMFQESPTGPPVRSRWQVLGTMLTVTVTGTAAQGKPFKVVQYFERIK